MLKGQSVNNFFENGDFKLHGGNTSAFLLSLLIRRKRPVSVFNKSIRLLGSFTYFSLKVKHRKTTPVAIDLLEETLFVEM